MQEPETTGCRQPTVALRLGSSERLIADLAAYMLASEPDVETDFRDVVTGFPPFADCAQRIGADPIEIFRSASAGRSAGMHELAIEFAGRGAVVLDDWDWELVEMAEGPCYRLKNETTLAEFTRWYQANISRDIRER
jgi:hypothetical protein